MSMFQGAQQPNASTGDEKAGRTAAGERLTYVAAGTRIDGDLTAGTPLTVDGEVTGHLTLNREAVIGTTGLVRGSITARSVRVAGKVLGDVQAEDCVEILSSGHLEGDVAAPRVVINDGGFFKGKVEVTREQRQAQGASAADRSA